jgi:hypothetical protein
MSVTLITSSTDEVTLKPEGENSLLANLPGFTSLNTIGVIGRARMGKSFLASLITNLLAFFQVRRSALPVTRGVHMFNSPTTNQIVFDTEGMGINSIDHDIRLLVPILLVCRVIIVNWKANIETDSKSTLFLFFCFCCSSSFYVVVAIRNPPGPVHSLKCC